MSPRDELKMWQYLIESPAWEKLREIVDFQQNQRILEIVNTPAGSGEEIAKENYLKGEISGLALALRTPHGIIETLTAQIKQEQLQAAEQPEEMSDDSRSFKPNDELDD